MRKALISLFGIGVLLLVAISLSDTQGAVRVWGILIGGGVIAAAGAMDGISKMREARLQPYTTSDWLKGKRRPGGSNPGLHRWLSVLAVCCWAAAAALSGSHSQVRQFLYTFLVVLYATMIGLGLFRKPTPPGDPVNS